MRVVAVVQARTGSTRLPAKVLAEIDGRPMLSYMLDRLRGLPVDQLVVATTEATRDQPVAEIASAAGAAVVRGPESDVLARFELALAAHPAEILVRLTADCPLIDPKLVSAVIELHQTAMADYTCNVLPRTFPRGLDVEVISADALRRAVAESQDPVEREHVTPYLYRHPERFHLANFRSGEDLGAQRWTVDTPEDLEFVRSVATALAGKPGFGWRDVLAVVGRPEPSSEALRLRPAESFDAAELLAWRNDPDAVQMSRSRRAIGAEEHRRWLARRLNDPGSRIWIAEHEGSNVGSVRIDVTDAVGEISIVVAPEARGVGTGTAMLRRLQAELRGELQVVALEAAIHPANIGSQRAFERAGFTRVGTRDTFLLLRWTTMDRRMEEQ